MDRRSANINSGLAGDAHLVQQTTVQQTTVCEHTPTLDTASLRNVEATSVSREFVKDALITERTNETVREAPIVHEKHVYHQKPVLQETHIVKEVPVIERTVVHEQPQTITRQVVHEQPVLIKQQQVVTEQLPTQHEVQHVQHELKTIQDTAFQAAPHVHTAQTTQTTQAAAVPVAVQKTTTVQQKAVALENAKPASQLQGQAAFGGLQQHGLQSTLDASRTGKQL